MLNIVYCSCSPMMQGASRGWRLVMTLFMSFMIFFFFAIIALLWCFRGFSRELQHPRKPVGYVVRLKEVELAPRQSRAAPSSRTSARRATTINHKARAASVVSLAPLLGSR
jgi:hypothetical protein